VKKFSSLLAIAVGLFAALPAVAAPTYSSSTSSSTTYANSNRAMPYASSMTPDYVIAALGGYDFDKNGGRDSVDYRLEYQWGASLLPMMNHDWSSLDRWVQLHPVAGFEGNGDGMSYFNGGLNLDVPVVSHIVFTWGENVGWYGHGDSHQSLGSPIEFRSQLELGWQFDNSMRLMGYISHLSNMGIGDRDPGAEILGAQLSVPVGWLAR
jgi:lipid A 3-O-deacylase